MFNVGARSINIVNGGNTGSLLPSTSRKLKRVQDCLEPFEIFQRKPKDVLEPFDIFTNSSKSFKEEMN
jgi:hypothetical protein